MHLIAHSLGSAMALDVLSHQPTKIPHFDFSSTSLHSDIFEFDTKNLFICGSPAGFFLLLNKGMFVPSTMTLICADESIQQIYSHDEAETSLAVKAMTDSAVLPGRLRHMAV